MLDYENAVKGYCIKKRRMNMLYVANAFSLNMLPQGEEDLSFRVQKLTLNEVRELVFIQEYKSCIGHADTASVVSSLLGVTVQTERMNVVFTGQTKILVAQYKGPRLPEGATTLPPGATIEWLLVTRS